jgi:hypothetical protein
MRFSTSQTAASLPFDPTGTNLTARNTRDALLELLSTLIIHVEEFTLQQSDLDNGYVELTTTNAVNNSINLFVGRLAFHQGLDYNLASAPGTGNLRIEFSGSLLPGQDEELAVGDYIRVTYWTI